LNPSEEIISNPLNSFRSGLLSLVTPGLAVFILLGVDYPIIGYSLCGLSFILTCLAFLTPLSLSSIASIALSFAMGVLLIFDNQELVLFYPVIVAFGISAAFIKSLTHEKTIVELIALKMEPDMPEEALNYCRKVHIVWAIVITLNAFASLITALYGDVKLWAWYNGFLSYMIMALVFLVEYLIRQRVRKRIKSKAL